MSLHSCFTTCSLVCFSILVFYFSCFFTGVVNKSVYKLSEQWKQSASQLINSWQNNKYTNFVDPSVVSRIPRSCCIFAQCSAELVYHCPCLAKTLSQWWWPFHWVLWHLLAHLVVLQMRPRQNDRQTTIIKNTTLTINPFHSHYTGWPA